MDVPRLLTGVTRRAAGLVNDAGAEVLRRLQNNRLPGTGAASVTDDDETAARRWRAVTVLAAPEQVSQPPAPLAALGDRVELRIGAAPGDKGTEIAARFRTRPSDDDLARLRAALRQAKQLIEVGEVLRVEPQPHGSRTPTPQGALLEGMTKRAPKEGVL